uniref:Uncharacterized protein n=1 Tax=Oryza sativa subsp. japonica TaxID=39947 RepID=Q6Z0C6_ORYSJ|nr:hypothetical protein [Oryza sativa Japonica Group]BAD11629.1 hypothetical protein [Oryza sativa Japonica Group]
MQAAHVETTRLPSGHTNMRDERHDDRGRRGGDEGSRQQLHGGKDGVEHAVAMPTIEAAPRDDKPVRRNGRPEETSTRTNDDDDEDRQGSGGGEETNRGSRSCAGKVDAKVGATAVIRRLPNETEERPGWRSMPRYRRRRRRRRPALWRSDQGDWRRYSGGNAPPMVSARNGGDAGGGEAAATPREETAWPAGAWARRERRLEVARGTGERGRWRGEAVWPRGAREEAKTRERTKGVPFYRRREGAGHRRGRNGGGNGGRRPWKGLEAARGPRGGSRVEIREQHISSRRRSPSRRRLPLVSIPLQPPPVSIPSSAADVAGARHLSFLASDSPVAGEGEVEGNSPDTKKQV